MLLLFFFLFFFLTLSRSMFHGKFVKSERFLAVLWEHVIFNVKWVKICKINEIFWAKLYYKMTDLFWLWDFLLEDLKFKELWWSPLARVDKYFFFIFCRWQNHGGQHFYSLPPSPLLSCSVKKVFLENSQNLQEKTCARVSLLIKLQVKVGNFILKKTLAQVFSVNLWNFEEHIFLQNTSGGCFLFFKIDVLVNFLIFTRIYLCWSPFLIQFEAWRPTKKRLQHKCFPVKFLRMAVL